MDKLYNLIDYKFVNYPVEIQIHPHDNNLEITQSCFSIIDTDVASIVAIVRNLCQDDDSNYYCDIDARLTNICQIDYFYSRIPLKVLLNPHGIICNISPYESICQLN